MEYINRKPLIICIGGKAGSGKNTTGNYLSDLFANSGLKVIVSPYTKYLKQYIYDITGNMVTDDNKQRGLLQNLSSELIKGKLNNKDFFINREIEDIEFYSYFVDVIIINDVRFPREIDLLKNKFPNVISIGVIRKDYDNKLSFKEKNDITEISLDNYKDYDYVIDNNDGSLKDKVIDIYKDIEKRN